MRQKAGLVLAAFVFLCPLVLNNLPFWRHAFLPGGMSWESLAVLGRHGIVPLLGAGLWSLAAWSLGSRILRLVRGMEAGDGHPAFSFALGTGAFALAVFFLGIVGMLRQGPLLALAVIGCGAAVPMGMRGFASISAAKDGTEGKLAARSVWSAGDRLLAGTLGICAWHTLILALAPAVEWDVLLYHLSLPKLYLGLGRITEVPWLLYSHWPHLMEVLYSLPLSLGDDAVPALMHLAACWMLVSAVHRAACEELGSGPALAASALVACQPVFLRIGGTAHSDGAFALFHFLGAWALWKWRSGKGLPWLALAGSLAGLAASTKLIGASLLAANTLLVWWGAAGSRSGRSSTGWGGDDKPGPLAEPVLYAACGLALVLPWYVKTAIGTGNPVWPMFSDWLGGRFGAEMLEGPYVRSSQWPWPLEAGRLSRWGPQYLLVPLAGLWGLAQGRQVLGGDRASSRAENIPGFLKFLLSPLALYLPLVIRYEDAWRYLLPFFPAFAMVAAWSASRVWSGQGRTGPGLAWARTLTAALVAFGLSPALMATQNNELFAVAGARSRLEPGRGSRELFLERTLDHYRAFRGLARVLPRDARVMFVREARGYYFEGSYQWGDPLDQGLVAYRRLPGPEALGSRLRELGVTHVLVNEVLARDPGAARSYDPRSMALIRGLLDRCPVIFQEGPIAVYRLDPGGR